MYATEVSYGVSSSKNIIPMFSKIPRHWLIRFVIGCGQFWLLPRTAEEKNDLDAQRNQAGVRSESAASTKQRDSELSEGSGMWNALGDAHCCRSIHPLSRPCVFALACCNPAC